MIEAEFLHNPFEKGIYCHCPSILETQSGSLIVVWYAYPKEEYANATLVISTKKNNANTFGLTKPVLISGKYSVGNPILFQEPGGRIQLLYVVLRGNYWNDAYLQGIWSDDDGRTWSSPTQLWQKPGMMIRHPPILLDSGTYLLPAYDERGKQSVLLSSVPPYNRWQETYRFDASDIIQSTIVKSANGKLIKFFRPATDPRRIRLSKSVDDGKTWSPPNITPLPNPLSGISAFSANNNLVVVYNHTEEHQRWPLSVSWSRDDGKSWDNVRHIDEVKLEVSYPSFIVGKDNFVHGVYTYNRRKIKYVKFSEDWFK
jgi:predicted neuraminidase